MKTNHKLKIDYKGCHEGLWNWLADNPDRAPWHWPGFATLRKLHLWSKNDASCFACKLVETLYQGCSHGTKCPVDFGTMGCLDEGSFYYLYNNAIDRSANARKIAKGWKK